MVHYGVTGTSHGMTASQLAAARKALAAFGSDSVQHNGLCIGADEEFAKIGRTLGHKIIGFPGYSRLTGKTEEYRSRFIPDICKDPRPYIDRNHDIVHASTHLVAAPRQMTEVLRSGTWATIRYAQKHNLHINILLPRDPEELRGDA